MFYISTIRVTQLVFCNNAKYETLYYPKPTACKGNPLATEGIYIIVFKINLTTDPTRYTTLARGGRI